MVRDSWPVAFQSALADSGGCLRSAASWTRRRGIQGSDATNPARRRVNHARLGCTASGTRAAIGRRDRPALAATDPEAELRAVSASQTDRFGGPTRGPDDILSGLH